MFYHLILGLLRDGRSRHAYELMQEFRMRSGQVLNQGNFYRECGKLVTQGLIAPEANPPEADQRRIPYRITRDGCREFDDWLFDDAGSRCGSAMGWLMFADMLSPADRLRLLDGVREQLWAEVKALGRSRERLATRRCASDSGRYQPALLLMVRRIKLVSAEIEFLDQLRSDFAEIPVAHVTVASRRASRDVLSMIPPPGKSSSRGEKHV